VAMLPEVIDGIIGADTHRPHEQQPILLTCLDTRHPLEQPAGEPAA
jgi:hypothetical protein